MRSGRSRSASPPQELWEVDHDRLEDQMLPRNQLRAYARFYDSARKNEFLDERTTILIHLAVSMAVGCYP